MNDVIDVSDIPAAALLSSLYNGSRQLGMGFLHERGQRSLSEDEAADLLKHDDYFDYLHGRVMKVRIDGKTLNPALYDRDNGNGAARRIVENLRA